jgi:hypothetical protein
MGGWSVARSNLSINRAAIGAGAREEWVHGDKLRKTAFDIHVLHLHFF